MKAIEDDFRVTTGFLARLARRSHPYNALPDNENSRQVLQI